MNVNIYIPSSSSGFENILTLSIPVCQMEIITSLSKVPGRIEWPNVSKSPRIEAEHSENTNVVLLPTVSFWLQRMYKILYLNSS